MSGITAYDGSSAPQRRELSALERDVLCRVLADIEGELRQALHTEQTPDLGPVRGFDNIVEIQMLRQIPAAIDPRGEE